MANLSWGGFVDSRLQWRIDISLRSWISRRCQQDGVDRRCQVRWFWFGDFRCVFPGFDGVSVDGVIRFSGSWGATLVEFRFNDDEILRFYGLKHPKQDANQEDANDSHFFSSQRSIRKRWGVIRDLNRVKYQFRKHLSRSFSVSSFRCVDEICSILIQLTTHS